MAARAERGAETIERRVVADLVPYGLAVMAQFAVFPVFGLVVTVPQSLGIGAMFTGLSLVRSYVLRRLFDCWGTD